MSLNLSVESDYYFSEKFKCLMRSNKAYLLENSIEMPLAEDNIVYAHRYDFYKLMRVIGVEQKLWWVTALINDIKDPFMDVSGYKSFLFLNSTVLDNIISRSLAAKV